MVEEVFEDVQPSPTFEIDMVLPPEQITPKLLEDIRRLEPFGEGFPVPTFMCDAKLTPVSYNENRLELKSNRGAYFVCRDTDLSRKILKKGGINGKVAYQIDYRYPKKLILLDVAEDG